MDILNQFTTTLSSYKMAVLKNSKDGQEFAKSELQRIAPKFIEQAEKTKYAPLINQAREFILE